jgi:hypothetical protein
MHAELSFPFQQPMSDSYSGLMLTNKDFAIKPKTDGHQITTPYVIRNAVIINEGIHNGDYYPAQELESNVDQFEGLGLFKDHHQNPTGGTVSDWCGEIRNPRWDSKLKSIIGDLWIVDETLAKNLHYGAKFGLSVTVDADIRSDSNQQKRVALDPVFRSCSFVLDPAVRQTMLNENKQSEVDNTEIEKTNAPLVDEGLVKKLEALEAAIAELKKKPEEVYPYPKKAACEMTDEELEAELAKRKKPPYPEQPVKMDSRVQELEVKLKEYQSKELEARVGSVMDKEVKIGLLESKDSETGKLRAEELKKLSAESLSAVEANLDRTLKIMEAEDSKPALVSGSQPSGSTQRREYSQIDLAAECEKANKGFHRLMLAAQGM